MSISIVPGLRASGSPIGPNRIMQCVATLVRMIALWPSRIRANRELLTIMGGMSEYELSDIGLTRQDVMDSSALPLTSESGAFFAARVSERRRRR